MNLRQITYFISIAQTGSFSAAADSLHVAQSALSRHMRDLEEELGGALFDRGPRGVALSDAGKVLFGRAKFILLQLEEARTEVLAHNKELIGTVRLMAPSSIGQILFQPLVDQFLGRFPKVFLEFSEGLWNDSVNRLQAGTVDIAIMGKTRTSDYIDLEPLAYEQMVLLGRESDPLVSNGTVPVEALVALPLLMPETTLDMIRHFAPHLADKVRVSIFVESAPTIRSFTESGHGYAVVPRSVVLGTLEHRRIKGVPIQGLEVLRQIGTLRGRPRSRGMRELSAAIRHEFDGFIAAGLMRAP